MSPHCSAIFTPNHFRSFIQIVERSCQCPIYLMLKQIPTLSRKFHPKVIALFHRVFRQLGITSSAVPTWAQPRHNISSFISIQDRKAGFGGTKISLNSSKPKHDTKGPQSYVCVNASICFCICFLMNVILVFISLLAFEKI